MRAFAMPLSSPPTADRPRCYAARGFGQSHSTEVSLLLGAAGGLVLAMVFYMAIMLLTKDSRLGQIFLNRGWVTKAEVGLATWAICFMALKYVRIRRQCNLAGDNPLAHAPETFASRGEIAVAAQRLAGREDVFGDSILHRRVYRALERGAGDGHRGPVADSLHSLALLDAGRAENSYSILRVIIWAIPIIGFIGTVAGLGGAVGGFSESLAHATDFAQLKGLLGGVTAGLSVAFDATFVALLISLLLMFPASALEKRETALLSDVDEFCQHELLGRLPESSAGGQNAEALVELFGQAIAQQQDSFLKWWHQANETMMQGLKAAGAQVCTSAQRLQVAVDSAAQQSQAIAANLKTGADHSMNAADCLRIARTESEGVKDSLAGAAESSTQILGSLDAAGKHSATIPMSLLAAESHARNAAGSAQKIGEMLDRAAGSSEKLKVHVEKAMRAASHNVAASVQTHIDDFRTHTAAIANVARRLQAAMGDEESLELAQVGGNGNGEL